ncbi:DUF3299 domain-containing protein [Burkholderiaceae bacterium DAT-1]|nr:DUF3299 domain-containing protein [Burkholderiaceae bacterium DAT-1]
MIARHFPFLALLVCLQSIAGDHLPGNLPAGPAPKGNAMFGVTEVVGKPVEDKSGFVSWKTLAMVKVDTGKTDDVVTYDKQIESLHNKVVKLHGFMLPLGMGEKQSRFILTATPPTCAFCLPGGPEQVIEVRAAAPIRYSYDAIELTGTFEVLHNDPMGLYYRVSAAKEVK